MPAPLDVSAQVDEAIRFYLKGHSFERIAQVFGHSRRFWTRTLKARGITVRTGSKMLPIAEIAARYNAGESADELAAIYGVTGPTIRKAVAAGGGQIRSHSDAFKLSRAKWPKEVEQKRVEAARRATMHVPREAKPLEDAAKSRQKALRSVGLGENEMAEFLGAIGFQIARQVPVSAYNIDLAVGTVAVEICNSRHHPLLASRWERYRTRIEKLTDAGWSIVFVWITGTPPTVADANQLIALLKAPDSFPTAKGQHWVVRRGAKTLTGLRLNRHKRP
jgi:hypothetical protein